MLFKKTIIQLILLSALVACRHSIFDAEMTETITDLGGGTGTRTWTSDKSYLLSGFVFVNDGQTLTIEAGTIIRARTGQGSLSSALIVSRGGKIIAEGTPDQSIIFTVEGDDFKGSIPIEAKGLWGGLILLGNAPVNTDSGEDMIEGIPISEPRGVYGGYDQDDNSGILQYISIRHGGTNIGEGNEINGLTLGGVGRKTIIDHIEVIANEDDGVEIFGGTVDIKNIVVSLCGDDAFDFDQGYNGKSQFLLAVIDKNSDKAIEISGGLRPLQILPEAFPEFYNVSIYGKNINSALPIIEFDRYGGGHIYNSAFFNTGKGIAISNSELPGDSYQLFLNGGLDIKNNEYFNASDSNLTMYCFHNSTKDFSIENKILSDSLAAWNNQISSHFEIAEGSIKLLPLSTLFSNLKDVDGAWYEKVSYKGAFGSENWTEGWTLFYESGM